MPCIMLLGAAALWILISLTQLKAIDFFARGLLPVI
ncbi:hypothetical protein Lser_V15G33856 [Lactuca serriola]